MLPSSWKGEIQETIDEATKADRLEQDAQTKNGSSQIAAALEALRNAQNTQTKHEDKNHEINAALNGVTIFLVSLTAMFTGLSWWVFRGQLDEMRTDQRPWVTVQNVRVIGLPESGAERPIFNLQYELRNFGRSIAYVIASGVVVIDGNWDKYQSAACKDVTSEANGASKPMDRWVVLPENVFLYSESGAPSVGRTSKQIKDAGGAYSATVSGCIRYRFGWEDALSEGHYTKFFIGLYAVTPDQDPRIEERAGYGRFNIGPWPADKVIKAGNTFTVGGSN